MATRLVCGDVDAGDEWDGTIVVRVVWGEAPLYHTDTGAALRIWRDNESDRMGCGPAGLCARPT